MESRDTEKNRTESIHIVMQNITDLLILHVYCENKMAYNREEILWAWLSVVFSKDFFVKCTALAKKKPIYAEMTINTSANFELYFTEEEDDAEIGF